MAIIKCTECGHSVSTHAPMCPECGVPIENNLLPCPSCQKQVLKTDSKCMYCGCVLQEQHTQSTTLPNNPENTKAKTRKYKKQVVSTLLALILLSAAGAVFYYFQKQNALKQEYSTYLLLDGCTSINAYEDFIQRYPQSQYIADVKQRLSNIRLELLEWNRIQANGTKSDFTKFVSNHPASPYVNSCHNKIDSLDWLYAARTNTEEAYDRYLLEHANGAYAQEAAYRIEQTKKLAVMPNETIMIKGICNNFFSSLSAKDEVGIKKVVNHVLTSFMNQPQATPIDVINYMNQLFSDKEIQGIQFTINDDLRVKKEIVSDTTGVAYDVTFSVDQLINTSNPKKGGIVTYQVEAHIAPNTKVDRLNMQKKNPE